jgi:hypothetical protein
MTAFDPKQTSGDAIVIKALDNAGALNFFRLDRISLVDRRFRWQISCKRATKCSGSNTRHENFFI